MNVTIVDVTIPAMSTIGEGVGLGPKGQIVRFAGDHRPMRAIGEAIAAGEEPTTTVEGYQIVFVETERLDTAPVRRLATALRASLPIMLRDYDAVVARDNDDDRLELATRRLSLAVIAGALGFTGPSWFTVLRLFAQEA